MSEEVKSASINVPRAMFYSILINGASGFGLLIAFLWCADLSIATSSTAAFPFVPVLCDAVGSNAGGIAMVAIVTALTIFASMGAVAAASRMMWSFARDRGLPGWRTLSKVRKPYFASMILFDLVLYPPTKCRGASWLTVPI